LNRHIPKTLFGLFEMQRMGAAGRLSPLIFAFARMLSPYFRKRIEETFSGRKLFEEGGLGEEAFSRKSFFPQRF
jgi:hypothetical protein